MVEKAMMIIRCRCLHGVVFIAAMSRLLFDTTWASWVVFNFLGVVFLGIFMLLAFFLRLRFKVWIWFSVFSWFQFGFAFFWTLLFDRLNMGMRLWLFSDSCNMKKLNMWRHWFFTKLQIKGQLLFLWCFLLLSFGVLFFLNSLLEFYYACLITIVVFCSTKWNLCKFQIEFV